MVVEDNDLWGRGASTQLCETPGCKHEDPFIGTFPVLTGLDDGAHIPRVTPLAYEQDRRSHACPECDAEERWICAPSLLRARPACGWQAELEL